MDQYRILFDKAHDCLLLLTTEGRIREANQACSDMLGYGREELIVMSIEDIAEDDLSGQKLAHACDEKRTFSAHFSCKDSSRIPVEVDASRIFLEDTHHLYLNFRCISERKKGEREAQLAHAAINVSDTPFYWISPEGRIISVNSAACRSLGYTKEEMAGKYIWDIDPYYTQDDNRKLSQEIKPTGSYTLESAHRRKDGTEFPILVTVNSATYEGEEHRLVFVQDISERKRADERITYLAYYDEVTGLPNRRMFFERLQHMLAVSARSQRYGAILFIDIDNFKIINDTLGHHAGDMLLKEVSSRLCSTVREEDIVARLGGDEFVVTLEEVDVDRQKAAAHAKLVGEKLLKALSAPYLLNGAECINSASIGVALFQGFNQEIEELLMQSDLAMYEAKKTGRNMLLFFDPAMQEALEKRTSMEADLRMALEQGQFELHYQGRVDENGAVIGAEALLRWQHPDRGMVSPAEFIVLSEQTGLILPIGNWVLNEACATIKSWEKKPETRPLVLSINISPLQLRHADFVDTVAASITNSGIDPSKLELEITESMLHSDIDLIIGKMNALQKQGVRFSMDDFGTGYSSLSYLKRLPINQVKIDQSFVRDITLDQNDEIIVQLIIEMSRTLGLESIAEGVESPEQLDLLLRHGCRQFQGFLFSHPLPLAAFERALTN